jgi:hypothetical protein
VTTAAWIGNALWILNWFLLIPAWYLVAAAGTFGNDWNRSASTKAHSSAR